MIRSFLERNLLWSEGFSILVVVALIALIGLLWWRPAFYTALCFFVFSLFFFRNPERISPRAQADPLCLLSPADGKIVEVVIDRDSKIEGDYAQKISIFLSLIDVHVNRIPAAGTIASVTYHPGQFLLAFLPKSSELNEHNDIVIHCFNNKTIKVRQIAGTIARHIRCWVHPGETVLTGQACGMIRFGSRVELLLPATIALEVGVGQHVYGGETIIGRWVS